MNRDEDPDRRIAERLRLRGDPPRVARLSRRTLGLLTGVASLALAGVAGWALTSHRSTSAGERDPAPPVQAAPPQQIAQLPKDYATLPAGTPRLGPPLPGDLGRAILAGPGTGAAIETAASSARPNPASQQQVQQDRASRLFGPEAAMRMATTPAQPVAAPVAAGPTQITAVVASSQLKPPSSPYLLQAGSTIRAALVTGIRSDLPGPVIAVVTEDVFDSVTGRWKLIPQGARLIGAYDSRPTFGQSRVLLNWTRLILPDGRSLDLGQAPAADAQGYAGLSDGVDHRWGQLLGASLVSTLLGVGSELGATATESQLLQALRLGGASAANQVGQQLVGKTVDMQPSLTIRPGFPVRILIAQDVVLEPWTAP